MGPTRSSSSGRDHKKKSSKVTARDAPPDPSLPGVQKIKSSLRQTRRLLARDSLAADVRIETERRLKSLEADLAKAERTRKERNLATKYHKVKFFERQKVCRKIKQAKKSLDDPEIAPETLPSLRETLFSYRVDLNYILNYPKAKKYVSLFPPDSSKAGNGQGSSDTDRQREELRRWVRAAMEKGEMVAEPEETMDTGGMQGESMDWEEEQPETPQARSGTKGKTKEVGPSKAKGVPGDAFFEASDEDNLMMVA